ncbi:MAG: ATPase [Chlorobi bacterium]|nr:ATPase [Chlorobiota bacterium]
MKKTMKIVLGLMFLGTSLLHAQEQKVEDNANSKTISFKVWGNCGMCEERIEKAANTIEGVYKADWDKETKIMELSYDSTKTMVNHMVQEAIANVGYDTEMHKGSDEAYNELPGCCQYDRKE